MTPHADRLAAYAVGEYYIHLAMAAIDGYGATRRDGQDLSRQRAPNESRAGGGRQQNFSLTVRSHPERYLGGRSSKTDAR